MATSKQRKNSPRLPDAGVDWSAPVGEPVVTQSEQEPEAQQPSGMLRRTLGDTGVSLVKSAVGLPETFVGMADLVTGGRAGKLVEDAGIRFKDTNRALDDLYSPEYQAAAKKVQSAQGIVDTLKAAFENPSTIYHGAVTSMGSMLAGAPVGRAATALRAPGWLAGGIGEGAAAAGQNLEQVRQESPDGLVTGEQSGIIGASGAITAAISSVAGRIANRLGIGDVGQLIAGARRAGPEVQKGLARKIAEGFATEGLLQEFPQSFQEQVAQNIAQGKPWDEGAANAAVMGGLSGGLLGAGAAPFGGNPEPKPALLPETGPMSRAVNAATVAARGTPLDFTPTEIPAKGDGLAVQPPPDTTALDFEADPRFAGSIAFPNGKAPEQPLFASKQLADIHIGEQGAFGELQAVEAGGGQWTVVQTPEAANRNARANIEMWMQRAQPMEEAQAKDMAKRAESELNKPMTALPMPDGEGWTVVPRQWVTAPVLLDYTERAAAAKQAREAPVERAPRTGSTDGVEIDPTGPNAVARYIAEQAATNTPAARAFVQDYRAGRITDADVLALITPKPAAEPTPDERLAAAAKAGQVESDSTAGLILNREGKPFKTEMAAAREQKKHPGSQVVAVEGGHAVQPAPVEEANAQAPAATEAAAPQATESAVEEGTDSSGAGTPAAGDAGSAGVEAGSAGAVEAPRVKKLPFVSKAEGERLFGVPAKREKALQRIAKGTAFFGTKEKASDFITSSGLKDTHEAVEVKPGRHEAREKGAAQATAPAAPAPGSRVTNPDGSYYTVPKEGARERRNRLKAEREQSAQDRADTTAQAAPAEVDPLDAELQDALGKLGDVLGDVFGGKLNMMPAQYSAADLLPALSKVVELLVRKGFKSFAQATTKAAQVMRANAATAPHVDAISARQWKAAYNAIADGHEGTDTEDALAALTADEVKAMVSGATTGPEAATNSAATDTPAHKEPKDAARELDRPSPGALEGVPAGTVQALGGSGDAGAGAADSGRANVGRDGDAAAAGGEPDGSVGDGARAASVPARGKRQQRADGAKPRVRRSAGRESDAGLFDDAGRAGDVNPAPNAAPIPAPAFKPADFTITEDFALGDGGQKTKYRANVDAIRLLKQLEAEQRPATPDEQQVLARYVGWGGIAQAFDSQNEGWAKEYAELKDLLTPDEYADARQSTQYAHYTSREIIGGMYDALNRLGFTGGRILEPGSGVGNFMGLMPAALKSASRFTAVEREPIAAGIARNLYPLQNVQRADYADFLGMDDYYDAAIGNPPFASTSITDASGRKHLTGLSVHNYFFAKSVDQLREGGILAMVVSNSFLDAQTDTARRYISERTKLLGAIRLPNNAFSKNANTEVTTDIVFLQKRPESEWGGKAAKEDAKRWLDQDTVPDPRGGEPISVNRYFAENPDMMLGEMGRYGTMYRPDSPALVARPGQNTAALLAEAVKKLPEGVYVAPAVEGTQRLTDATIVALKDPTVQEGGHYVEGGKLYQRLPDVAGEARAIELTPDSKWTEKTTLGETGFARLVALSEMRTTLRGLLAAELNGSADMETLRAKLNEQYDAYVKQHGRLNDTATTRVFDDDPDFPLLASLEHDYVPGIGAAAAKRQGIKPQSSSAKKAPIFRQRVVDQRQQVRKVESPADALAVSMAERGRIDTAYIGQLLGVDPKAVLEELSSGAKPLLFLDPASDEYVLRDAYLSGNVRAKLKQAQQAGMFANARALEEVQPEDVGPADISARIGSPWVPEQVYQEFAKELFGEGTKAVIHYVKLNSSYSGAIYPGNATAAETTWGTKAYSGDDLLMALLNNREIKVTWRDSEGKTHVDKEATENANVKAQDIRARFSDWLFADADRSELLVRAYNDTNNNYVTRDYDGSFMTFPGKVPDSIIKFHRHQRNAIARIVQDRTALLDHVVGAGKTFTVVSAAMELKRTGLAKKPMIAVPNHLVKQWAADFYRLYPGANILTATKKDFAKANRRKFLAKIATGDWDAVVIAHSSFGFIRPAPDFEAQFNERQVKAIVDTIKTVEDGGGEERAKKRTVKQLEGLKERLENRIKSLRQKPMDALLDFEQIGVDQLFVDEAHLFKNLMFSTKMQNIRGLGDSKGSQRAYDMFVKVAQVFAKNGRGQGVVFATGTPVSNSLAEMYHMMRYLMPDQMEAMGFSSFDAWANTFAQVSQEWDQKTSGDGFKAINTMSSFVNTHELLRIFDQVSDTVTMDDIKAAFREENAGKEFPLPKLKTGRRQPVSLVKTEAQDAYMKEIAERAAKLEARKGPPQKGEDNALVLMTDARKAAMDIRLVNPEITEREQGGRIDQAASNIFTRWQQTADVKGTQLVFSDLGTPIKTVKRELAEYQELKARADVAQDTSLTASAMLGDEAAIAKLEDAEEAQAELDKKGSDWLTAIQAALRGFSVYDDLKAALIERGIPADEIAFIHDFNTDEQKAGLFRKVNSGQIRVLLGSTAKMGAGTNVQERLVALHHLDVPWKPSDIEQREGRIVRQGNRLQLEVPGFEAEILAYVTQDTLDMKMWMIQERKLKMINQLRTRKIDREIENSFEDMEMSAGEMQAAATGNMDLLKEIQLRTDVKKLEQRKRAFDAQRNDLESRRRRASAQLGDLPAQIKALQPWAKAGEAWSKAAQEERPVSVTINGERFTSRADAAEALRKIVDAHDERLQARQEKIVNDPTLKAADVPMPKLAVEFNGKTYGSKAAVAEAFMDAVGDAARLDWTFNGTTYTRRSKLAAAMAQDVADAIATDTARELGSFGPFQVSVEGTTSRLGDKLLDVVVSLDGETASSDLTVPKEFKPDAAERLGLQVVSLAERLATRARSEIEYAEAKLASAKRAMAELNKTSMPDVWPDAEKLDKARAEHREILGRLSATREKPSAEGGEAPAFSRSAPAVRPRVTVERDESGFPIYLSDKVRLEFPQVTARLDVIEAPGEKVVNYPIMSATGFDVLGYVELLVKDGKAKALLDIEVDKQGRQAGVGRDVIETLLAADGAGTLEISNIVPEARGFWEKMGIPPQNVEGAYDGALTWKTYAEAQNTGATRGAAEGSQAAREGADAAAEGRIDRAPGSARGEREASTERRKAVEALVARVTARWKNAPQVVVVASMADPLVPRAVRQVNAAQLSQGAEGSPEGFFHDGKVYLVAPQLRGDADVVRVLFHEALGHYGLRGTFGPELGTILDRLAVLNAGKVRAKAKQYGLDYDKPSDRRMAAEEVLAEMAQKAPDIGWAKKAVAAIRTWLRERVPGFRKMAMSDDEIVRSFILPARAYVQRGNAAPADGAGQPAFSRSSLADAVANFNQEGVRNAFLDAVTTHGKTNLWGRTVGTQYHKAQTHPTTFGRVFNAVQDYIKDTSVFANRAADLAPSLLPKLDTAADLMKDGLLRHGADPKDTAKAGEAIFQGTLNKELYDDATLRSRFGLTPKQVELYREFRAAVDQSLEGLGKTEILRIAGEAGRSVRAEVLAAPSLDDAAEILTAAVADDQDAVQQIQEKVARVTQLQDEGYAPLMRFGKHTLHVTGPGGSTEFFGMYETVRDANRAARQLRADPEMAKFTFTQGVMSEEGHKLFNGLSMDSLELFADTTGRSDDPVFQAYLKLAIANRSALKRMIERQDIKGYSDDVARVLASFVTSNARMSAGHLHLADAKKAAEAIPKEQGDLRDDAIKLVEYVTTPTEEAAAVRGLLFTSFIGGSVASALVNMTQPITMTLPYLTQYGGAAKAGKRLTAAMAMVASGKGMDPELAAALKRAEDDGIVSPQEIHHLQAQAMNTLGKNPLLKKAAFVWGALFSLAEQFNRRVSFVAAYETAKQQGIADPFGFAEKAVIETQGLYNKGNKANVARGAVGATVMTFKQFSTHYLEFLVRMWKSGPEGKKAVAVALALLILMGGAGGLPFADDLDDLIDTLGQAMGYDTNSKRWKRQFVAQTLGLGDAVADVATRGLTAAPGFPLDLSLRMGMGNLLPATGLFLRSNTDTARQLLEVAGAAGGLAANVKDGVTKAMGDDLAAGAMSAMPVAVQNIAKAIQMAQTGEYRNAKGAKVMDVDVTDAVMKGIGFQPAQVARESGRVGEAMRSIQLAKNVEGEIAGRWAQAMVDQDPEGVAAAKKQLADWNAANPTAPIKITIPQVLARVKALRQSRADRTVKAAPKEMRSTVKEALS